VQKGGGTQVGGPGVFGVGVCVHAGVGVDVGTRVVGTGVVGTGVVGTGVVGTGVVGTGVVGTDVVGTGVVGTGVVVFEGCVPSPGGVPAGVSVELGVGVDVLGRVADGVTPMVGVGVSDGGTGVGEASGGGVFVSVGVGDGRTKASFSVNTQPARSPSNTRTRDHNPCWSSSATGVPRASRPASGDKTSGRSRSTTWSLVKARKLGGLTKSRFTSRTQPTSLLSIARTCHHGPS